MFKHLATKAIRPGLASLFLITLIILPMRAAATTLPGGWACLWHLTVQVNQGAGNVPIFNFNQLMQLTVASTGSISGSMFYSFPNGSTIGGEVCDISVSSGTLSVGANGVGNLTVTFSVPSTAKDEDKDVACSQVLGANNFTQSYRFVAARSNTKLYFVGRDPFVTNVSGDTGDFPSVSGVCERQ